MQRELGVFEGEKGDGAEDRREGREEVLGDLLMIECEPIVKLLN